MACAGCQGRRNKVRAWFRTLIQVPSKHEARKEVRTLGHNVSEQFMLRDEVFEKQDAIVGKWLRELQTQVDRVAEDFAARMNVLRELNKNCKEMIRKQDDRISELEGSIAELTETVKGLEFPKPEPIDYTIDD